MKTGDAAFLRIEKGSVGHPGHPLIEEVDLEVAAGDYLAVVGPNGSGKTTLLRTMLGVLPLLRGKLERGGRFGHAPQRQELDPIFPFTAAEVVEMGLLRPLADGEEAMPRARRLERIESALSDCGVVDLAARAFRDLSGGQRQRVLVARALVSDPQILILDEPTNDLDLAGEHEVMELIDSLNDSGRAVVLVSHMLHVVARHAHSLAIIHDRRIDQGSLEEMLVPERLERLYGMPVAVHDLGTGRMVAPRPGEQR